MDDEIDIPTPNEDLCLRSIVRKEVLCGKSDIYLFQDTTLSHPSTSPMPQDGNENHHHDDSELGGNPPNNTPGSPSNTSKAQQGIVSITTPVNTTPPASDPKGDKQSCPPHQKRHHIYRHKKWSPIMGTPPWGRQS